MNPTRTYSPFLPQTAPISAEILRADTCDTRRVLARHAVSVSIPNSSFLIPHWTRHPDHLGSSSSWITYTDGSAVQHLYYLPWGEDFVDQRSTTWNAMYTFSAKEKDAETGYSYFGARYYNSDLSVWLNVDPQASKYPSLSPYVYCADNPIKLVDPNGEAFTPETVWDIINVVMGAASFAGNISSGNYIGAGIDAIGLLYDAAATAIPGLPAGASSSIGAIRLVKSTNQLYKTIEKVNKLNIASKNQNLFSLSKRASNAVKDHLKLDDIVGMIKDLMGNPVVKEGKQYNHLQEVDEALNSPHKYKTGLEKVIQNNQKQLTKGELKTIETSLKETDNYINRIEAIKAKTKKLVNE